MSIEADIRQMIAEVVREEVARALAERDHPDEYLSTAAAATLAHVTPATVRRWIREGQLLGYRAGRRVRVRRSDLEQLLRSGAASDNLTPEQRADRDFG